MCRKNLPLTLTLLLLTAVGCGKTETPVAKAGTVPPQAAAAAPPPGPPVKVPDVTTTHRFVADGIVALQEKGFAVAVSKREDAANQPGYIIDQAPDGLASRPKGSVIRLTVATRGQSIALSEEDTRRLTATTAAKLRKKFEGDFEIIVPPVEGRRAIDAMLALQQRGLKINLDAMRFREFPHLVVASQNPAAQQSVAPGTTVEIKCMGNDIEASQEELARLTKENQAEFRHARERMDAVHAGQGRG